MRPESRAPLRRRAAAAISSNKWSKGWLSCGPGAALGVVLDREDRQLAVAQALDRAVVQVDVADHRSRWRRAPAPASTWNSWFWLVMATRPVSQVLDRVVAAVVAERQPAGGGAGRQPDDLVPQADAHDRDAARDQPARRLDGVGQLGRVARPVREQDARPARAPGSPRSRRPRARQIDAGAAPLQASARCSPCSRSPPGRRGCRAPPWTAGGCAQRRRLRGSGASPRVAVTSRASSVKPAEVVRAESALGSLAKDGPQGAASPQPAGQRPRVDALRGRARPARSRYMLEILDCSPSGSGSRQARGRSAPSAAVAPTRRPTSTTP